MPSLPKEVWDLILDYLSSKPQPLKQIRLVNRLLNETATPQLFRKLVINPSPGSWERAEAVSNAPHLYRFIETLEFNAVCLDEKSIYQDFPAYFIYDIHNGLHDTFSAEELCRSSPTGVVRDFRKAFYRYYTFIVSSLKWSHRGRVRHFARSQILDGGDTNGFRLMYDGSSDLMAVDITMMNEQSLKCALHSLSRSIVKWGRLKRVHRRTPPQRGHHTYAEYSAWCMRKYGLRYHSAGYGIGFTDLLNICAGVALPEVKCGGLLKRDWGKPSAPPPYNTQALARATLLQIRVWSVFHFSEGPGAAWRDHHVPNSAQQKWLRGFLGASPYLQELEIDLHHNCGQPRCTLFDAVFTARWHFLKHLKLEEVRCSEEMLCQLLSEKSNLESLSIKRLELWFKSDNQSHLAESSVLRLIWALAQQPHTLKNFVIRGKVGSEIDGWKITPVAGEVGLLPYRIGEYVCKRGPFPFLPIPVAQPDGEKSLPVRVSKDLLPPVPKPSSSLERLCARISALGVHAETSAVSETDIEDFVELIRQLKRSEEGRDRIDDLFTDSEWRQYGTKRY